MPLQAVVAGSRVHVRLLVQVFISYFIAAVQPVVFPAGHDAHDHAGVVASSSQLFWIFGYDLNKRTPILQEFD